MPTSRTLRIALAGLILIGGLIHLQQFFAGFSAIPIIGPMFLANAIASAVVAALLVWRSEPIWVMGAVAIAGGSLGAFFISRGPGLFGYVSTTFELAEAVAVISEVAALLVAGAILAKRYVLTPAS